MNISVLIPTYKRPDSLKRILSSFCSLNTEGLQWEVLIVDNGDDAETEKVVRHFGERLPLRYLVETKRGKNNALNRGIVEARGGLFVFTDDDVIPDREWIIEIWEGTKRWPDYYVFGGRCLPKYQEGNRLPFEHPFFVGAFTIVDWDIPEGSIDAGNVWGTNIAIRASIFEEGWRFNPNLGPDGTEFCILGDETDFTTQLERAGYQAVYLPRSLVYHVIQKERMSFRWLYRRAFSFGREEAFIQMRGDRKPGRIGGIPRRLLFRLIKSGSMFAVSSLSKDVRHRFDWGLKYWHTKGMICQYRTRITRSREV